MRVSQSPCCPIAHTREDQWRCEIPRIDWSLKSPETLRVELAYRERFRILTSDSGVMTSELQDQYSTCGTACTGAINGPASTCVVVSKRCREYVPPGTSVLNLTHILTVAQERSGPVLRVILYAFTERVQHEHNIYSITEPVPVSIPRPNTHRNPSQRFASQRPSKTPGCGGHLCSAQPIEQNAIGAARWLRIWIRL